MNPTIKESGFVYVIHAVGTNRIKIGFSVSPSCRLAQLQTGSPIELQLLASWPGTEARERYIHRHLKEFRKAGEWFEVPPWIGWRIYQLVTDENVARPPSRQQKVRQQSKAADNWPEGGSSQWRIERNGGYYFFRNRFNRSTQPGGRLTPEIEDQCKQGPGSGRHRKSRQDAEQHRKEATQ